MITITPAQLRKAADIQERIQSLQEELGQLLGGEVPTPAQTTEEPKKRKVNAAGRARMRAAQIARWAKIKGTAQTISTAAKPAEVPKKKRKMSAAWRKALERAWAARRAKGKAAGRA
jgi:hypothetical protein